MLKRRFTIAHVRPSANGAEAMFCESARIYTLSSELKGYAHVLAALQQAASAQAALTVWLKDEDSEEIVGVGS